MSRTFTPEAIRTYRRALGHLTWTIQQTDDVQQMGEAFAAYDLALFAAWGLSHDDILAWAFATGQVDHEGRPL